MQIIDDLIEKMKVTRYSYVNYEKKNDTMPLLHSRDNSEVVMRQLLLEFIQQNVNDIQIENIGLKQRIMILEACVNNSNFKAIIARKQVNPNEHKEVSP